MPAAAARQVKPALSAIVWRAIKSPSCPKGFWVDMDEKGLAPLITETGVRGELLSGLSGDAFSALAMPPALSLGRGHRASYWAMPMPLASHFCPLRLHGAAR